jgi:hypothetical protein
MKTGPKLGGAAASRATTPNREKCMAGSLAASAKSSATAATIEFHLPAATKLAR